MEQNKDIVIIGCGAAGGTAAQFARKTDRKSSITIIEKGNYGQYSKCGLPYIVSGKIPKIDDLVEFDKSWFEKAKIDLLLQTNVEKIDIKNKKIIAKKENNTIEKTFSELIICTGSKPCVPKIENIDLDGVFFLRTIDDIKKVSLAVKKAKSATIVGAGLIGMEMADNLYELGIKITIVEALDQILALSLDKDMVKILKQNIPDDIDILTDHVVKKAESKDGTLSNVIVKNNKDGKEKSIQTDLLIIATGTNPNVSLAKDIGCKIGPTGGIIVNEKCETSIKDIYAAGDCTEYKNLITAQPCLVGLGSIAVRQAIAAGTNAAGSKYIMPKGLLYTATSELFGTEIASVGPTINKIDGNFDIVTGKYTGISLPDYYPGGNPISIKVVIDKPTGMIMAAQAVGDKAAQRINTFACAILGEMDVETFRKLETAYSPTTAPTLDVETLVCDIVSMKRLRNR